ncbi:MAG: cytochrome c3 family protein [Methylococcaceae bacterium]|nr:cytochrome c3 family protein [Methylococcaceae bacterium]
MNLTKARVRFLLLGLVMLVFLQQAEAREVSLASQNLLLSTSHGGDGSAWGLANCNMCHASRVIHRNAPRIRTIVKRKGYPTCTGCHGSNGTAEPRRCVICHNAAALPAKPLQTGKQHHGFPLHKSARLNDRDCLACHKASDMNGRFEPNIDLTRYQDKQGKNSPSPSIIDFCLRCHNRDHQQKGYAIVNKAFRDPLIAMEDNFTFIDKHGLMPGTGQRPSAGLREGGYRYPDVVQCTDCHAMHGTHNAKLIIDSSRKGVSRMSQGFRNKPYPVDIPRWGQTSADTAQLCVLCHRMKASPPIEQGAEDAGNGLSGVHAVNGAEGDCKLCHYHGSPYDVGGM